MKIALLMLSHEDEKGALQNNHIPLSTGVIGEFLRLNFDKDILELDLFKRPSQFETYLKNNSPDIVMLSNYMWNENLNIFYAKLVKNLLPKTLVIMGGPNISINLPVKEKFLRKNKCIDILVEGDGEIVSLRLLNKFYELDKSILDLKYAKTINCFAFDHISGVFLTSETEDTRLGVEKTSLDEIPSPYLSGLMDVFLEDGAIPLLESNRGCPYSCSFCQQGTKYFSKIRFFEGSRIHDEIMYIAKRRKELNVNISIVEFADPNFGQYKQDLDVFEGIRKAQDEHDFPSIVYCSTGKSQAERIMNHSKILKPGSIMIRAAMQSMNPETLKTVARKNLAKEVFEDFSRDGVETYSDIMLGLPMESLQSYVDGVLQLIDSNIDEFSMPQTLVLKGTPMEKTDYLEKYDIKTKPRVIPECTGFYGEGSTKVSEFEDMIMHTSTMSFDDYLKCRQFVLIVMIFHNTRLLKYIYKYLDHRGTERSILFREIYNVSVESETFAPVFDHFLKLSESELLSDYDVPDGTDLEELTSNKIYKFLSISLIKHQSAMIEIVTTVLNKPELKFNNEEREFFIGMLKNAFMSDIQIDRETITKKLPPSISLAFEAKTYECFLSEFQLSRIENLTATYPKLEDQENKLPYHLRPPNMVKTIRFA
ncbi:hypothetical protein N9299_06305 [Amylibacter sp.]|nr:hypothetical protein [Amylibacter sp.]